MMKNSSRTRRLMATAFLVLFAISPLATPWASANEDESIFHDDERYQLLKKQYDELVDYYWGTSGDVIVKKNGKMGVVNEDNDLFIPVQYDSISITDETYFVWNNKLVGLVDRNAKQIVPIEYVEISEQSNKGKTYYIVIKADPVCWEEYYGMPEFCDSQYGLLDSLGHVIVPVSSMVLQPMQIEDNDKQEGLIIVADLDNQLFGVIDFYGNTVIPMEYNGMMRCCHKNCIFVKKGDKCGVIDRDGNVVLPFEYDGIYYNGQYNMFATGKLRGEDDMTADYAFWDLNGKKLTDDIFTNVDNFLFSTYYDVSIGDQHFALEDYSEGLAAFTDYDNIYTDNPIRWGYLDTHGQIAITPRFSIAHPFSDGLAAVSLPDNDDDLSKFGYIDTQGNMILPVAYYEAGPFMDGYAIVANTDGKECLINRRGDVIKVFENSGIINLVRDNGQVFVEESYYGNDDRKYYNNQGRIVKAIIDGVTLYAKPE